MRTSIFTSFAYLPEEFKEHFAALWDLSEEQRLALIPHVSDLIKTETPKRSEEIMEIAISEVKGDTPTLLKSLKILQFISKQWDPTKDTPENFLKDLNELALIPSQKEEEGQRFFLTFFTDIEQDNLRRLRKLYAKSVLPSLLGIGAVVDLRPVFEKPHRLGDDVDSYQPRLVDFTPLVIVGIRRDSGDPAEFEFQCEPDDVRLIISKLQAALKELEISKQSLAKG